MGASTGAEEGPHWAVPLWKEDGDICPHKKTPAGSKDCVCDQFVLLPRKNPASNITTQSTRLQGHSPATAVWLGERRASSSQAEGSTSQVPISPCSPSPSPQATHQIPMGISRQVFPQVSAESWKREVPRKSQQHARRLLCIERQSHTCSTSYKMKIHPNANSGL